MSNAVLILAAGAASRMNKPKMLLSKGSVSILQGILTEIQKIKPGQLCLVTGYYHAEIVEQMDAMDISIVQNENWQEGMASSIRKGLSWLLENNPELSALMIVVSDQPYLNGALLEDMFQLKKTTQKGIVAAGYGKVRGTPVLFDRCYFPELLKLQGDTGAKPILQQNPEDIAIVDFPLGAIDIDTPEDYEKFRKETEENNA